MCVWQNEERRCAGVLREVFAWLDAASLARAGAACHAWRRAAAAPALWRHLLCQHQHESVGALSLRVCWRQEYVSAHAGWRLVARHGGGVALLHAQLEPGGDRLALASADAAVSVWRREYGAWRECGRAELRTRGWRSAARVQWPGATGGVGGAGGGARLLAAGPLSLADHWELLVLCVEEDGRCGAVVSRVRCSAGAAGCWADPAGDAFLSLELRQLGRGLFCTTVWLNAATQETHSEYAGVTMPLLRIFNEDGEHITHALVAQDLLDDDDVESLEDARDGRGPGDAYLHAIEQYASGAGGAGDAGRVLVAASGCRLAAWAVRAPRPAPLQARAAGGLAERVRRQQERRARDEDDEDAAEPDEASVRASCTPPARHCRLTASLVGLVLHERGRCMWAVCSDGSASCVSVAALRVLRRVLPPAGEATLGSAHYVQPAVSATYVAWPAGAYSGRVWWCAAATCSCGRAALAHGGAVTCCVLPPSRPAALLVLAGDELYEWQSRATPQCGSTEEAPCCGY